MIDLATAREPWWLDLPGGVRVHVRPLTTALMLASRQRLRQGEHEDAGEAMDEAARIEALVKALACEAILAWEGVVAAGEPAEPSPEAIAAVLDRWPVFEAFRDGYFAPSLLLDAEKNG
jgi:hypothetical protein